VDEARRARVPIRCIWFKTPLEICEHNDAVRANNTIMNPESRHGLPKVAFTGFASRYKPPQTKEGFEDITEVNFSFRGTKEEYGIWGRYWT
jgi:bifunctional polynucleotide phosphatase/kinase